MSKAVSPAELIELERIHTDLEIQNRIEATMATVAPHPRYEHHPMGYVISTRAAVEEMYRRILPKRNALFAGVTLPKGHERVKRAVAFGDNFITTETEFSFPLPNGEFQRTTSCVVMAFENKLVKSERVYLDRHYNALMRDFLGPSFAFFPGVLSW